jgi:hypothetical protein
MHIRKSNWFYAVVAMLKAEGFAPGGPACPKLVSSYFRKGVVVEIHGGCALHVVQEGRRVRHENLSIEDARGIIICARADGDYQD